MELRVLRYFLHGGKRRNNLIYNAALIIFPVRIIEPLYEAKSDQQIGEELYKHLGILFSVSCQFRKELFTDKSLTWS